MIVSESQKTGKRLKKIFDNAMLSQFFEIDMNTDVTE